MSAPGHCCCFGPPNIIPGDWLEGDDRGGKRQSQLSALEGLSPHPRDSGVFKGIRGSTISASPNWEAGQGTGHVMGAKEVEGVVASGAADKSLVGGPGWGWTSVLSLETERRKKRIPPEGGAGRCGRLAGRMYSEGCLTRDG